MKSILKATACMAVLATSGAGFATAQTVDDTVDVSMDVTLTRGLEFAMDGNIAVDAVNTLTQNYRDEFGNLNGDSQQIHTGYVEGCVHLEGVDRVLITVGGQNPAPDGAGPYLKYTDGSANDYFLHYNATLMGRYDDSKVWDNIAELAYNNNPNDSGFNFIGNTGYGPNFPLNSSTEQHYILGSVGGQTVSGCNGGADNNVALVVSVGVRDGHAYNNPDPNAVIQHFGSINNLAGASTLASDTAFSFSDQITITIAPDLS